MSYYINLHAHSNFSDGANTVDEIASTCKDIGFTACVITDHLYSCDAPYSLSYEKFKLQKELAEKASRKHDIPIILGVELGDIGSYEECLLFGQSAIVTAMIIRERKIADGFFDNPNSMVPLISFKEMKEIRDMHNCATVLCHPNLADYYNRPGFIASGGAKLIDAFEEYNSGQHQFNFRKIPDEFKNLHSLCNSDAHSIETLMFGYNEIESPITTEEELISYLKSNKAFRHVHTPRTEGHWSRGEK